MKTTLWQKLKRPTYLVSAGPWAALVGQLWDIVLFALAVTAVVAGTGLLSSVPGFSLLFFLLLLASPVLGVAAIPLVCLWIGMSERLRLRFLGFHDVTTAHVPHKKWPLLRWLAVRYTEPATWREVLTSIIQGLFLGFNWVLLVCETAFLWLCGSVLVVMARTHRDVNLDSLLPRPVNEGLALGQTSEDVLHLSEWWQLALGLVIGLIVFGYLNGLVAALSATVSRILLAPRPEEMQRQVDKIAFSRARIMESFEAERRRIERDLHDGVQQELVNLNLRLGMVDLEVGDLGRQGADVARARQEITRAQDQTQHALQTLRNTVRGIYPAVLEDHGLQAALEELANNCLLPVDLTHAACSALPKEVEGTAYYAASEAMTNALKHSTANRLGITTHTTEGCLFLEVRDNGQGGARVREGNGGINGLQERAGALGGEVCLDSPVGGPTTLHLRLPLSPTPTEQGTSVS